MTKGSYSSRLGAGLAMFEETRIFLDLWQPGMQAADLQRLALESVASPTSPRAVCATWWVSASHCAISLTTVGQQPC